MNRPQERNARPGTVAVVPNGPSQGERTVILFYNTMWDHEVPALPELPAGCEITKDRSRMAEADAVVFHVPQSRLIGLRRKRPGQLWVAWCIESEANWPRLRDPRYMSHFDLTMTYRRDSDVLWGYVPYYGTVDVLASALVAAPRPKDSERPVAMFISSRTDRSGRRDYARELARHIPVDSYGRFLRNRTLTTDLWRSTKLELIARYPFTIAFENSIATDYVTEKFYDPLVVGSVPVYLGAPNVDEYAPGDHCYINVRDYASPRALAAYLKSLLESPDKYDELVAWKRRPLRPQFVSFLESQRSHPVLRLCEAVKRARAENAS